MNLLDELKNLVTGGPASHAVVPTPEQAAETVSPAAAAISPEPVGVSSVPAAPAVKLDDNDEPYEYAANAADEAREDLPQRSRQRIAYLLKTYEAGHPELTAARIQNDRARYLMRKPVVVTDRRPNTNPQAHLVADPTAPTPSVGTWRV